MRKASDLIDEQVKNLPDWRGELFAKLRKLIHDTAPEAVEEWKWSTAVWTHNGLIFALGAFKDHVKFNFMKGASLQDPKHLFNAGLEAKTSRSIDFNDQSQLNETALKEIIRQAVSFNEKK